tara:strand:- start:21 stop:950 length:930 start_codon:yes stop_codon:yes gene_type:complete
MVPPGGTSAESNRGRGLIGNVGGEFSNGIHYVQIQTNGNSIDFGDLLYAKRRESTLASSTRGIFAGGDESPSVTDINYITIATTGQNALDFGDLSSASGMGSGCSSQTRGLIGLGYISSQSNTIDYITIATTGNASDFGDMTVARNNSSSLSSPTRGIWAGGSTPSLSDVIDYVTIASAGNATDFGNLVSANNVTGASASQTRGLFAGGGAGGSPNQYAYNVIQYITIASTGNAADFGDITVSRGQIAAMSNSVNMIFAGGVTDNGGNTANNTIDYVTISSLGNAVKFGETTADVKRSQGTSDSHGGIS